MQLTPINPSNGGITTTPSLDEVLAVGNTTTNTITSAGFIGDGSQLTNLPNSGSDPLKADKVISANNGNLAGLDASGNLTDSGSKTSDFDVSGAASAVQDNLDSLSNSLGTAAYVDTGNSNGNVPVLDSNGLLSTSVLPPLSITDTNVVASQAAMLALTAEVGDVAIRSDTNTTFILAASPASTLSNWVQILAPVPPVTSVNGDVGNVILDYNDVGADVAGAAASAQAASDPVGSASTVQGNLNTHAALTTTAHGGIVASTDSRLTDARTPTAHAATHVTGGGDTIANVIAAGNSGLMTGSDKTKLDGIASGATANAGTVTTVSVASANGFSGTVANSTTTPAITIIAGNITPSQVASTGKVTGTNIIKTVGFTSDGQGAVVSTGSKGFRRFEVAGTIVAWTIVADVAGTCTIDIKRSTYSGFPTTTSIVGAGTKPALASVQKNQLATAPSDWTSVTIAAGDVFEWNVDAATVITRLNFFLDILLT